MSEIFKYLEDISPVAINHGTSNKYVFASNDQMSSALTQVAYGRFERGDVCAEHAHPTMDEFFFFIKGEGKYRVGHETINIKANTFLRIPAGVLHSLVASSDEALEFVYWGIALEGV